MICLHVERWDACRCNLADIAEGFARPNSRIASGPECVLVLSLNASSSLLIRLTSTTQPHDVASGSVSKRLHGLLACMKAGTLIIGGSERYVNVQGIAAR